MNAPTNSARAAWADQALRTFMERTGTDLEDCLCDLLGPRQSRLCGGGQCDGGGGCIACDRNEEEECYALAAISR